MLDLSDVARIRPAGLIQVALQIMGNCQLCLGCPLKLYLSTLIDVTEEAIGFVYRLLAGSQILRFAQDDIVRRLVVSFTVY